MDSQPPRNADRYSRQILFEPIGEEGQSSLGRSRVTLIGCGALGTVLASTLVRAGVGYLRICDRDYIEPNNLQRQVLFDEVDIERNLPKSIAAAEKLARINSTVQVDPVVIDVNHGNIESLVGDAQLICDGTDNFETRYLINDVAIKREKPWIYAAVIGASGLVMPVLPRRSACLRCLFENAPPPEMSPTCDTAGVIGPAVNIVASLQAVEAIKLLTGRDEAVSRTLTSIDVWSGRIVHLTPPGPHEREDCPCCGKLNFEYLDGQMASGTTTLCGRNAVQINPAPESHRAVRLEDIAAKLAPVAAGAVSRSAFMVKATVSGYELTVFPDGRVIIKGTKNPDEARSVFARYIGG